MLAAGFVFGTGGLTDWDSWDYAAQIVRGHSSDLLLGRWWFIAPMRVVYLAAHGLLGLDPQDGHLAVQAVTMVLMAGAVVAGMALTYALTRSASAEVLFAAMVVCGPLIGIYASAVMTEAATLLMLTLALLGWERAVSGSRRAAAWALAAGLAFGILVDMRELAVLLAAWPVVSCFVDAPPRRWRLLLLAAAGAVFTLAIGVLGAWAWHPWEAPGYFGRIGSWLGAMVAERNKFPNSISTNLGCLCVHAFVAAPVAAVAMLPAGAWCALHRRRLFWLAVSVLPMMLALLLNHDLPINRRHALPAVWFLIPVSAAAMDGWWVAPHPTRRRAAAVAALVLLAGAAVVATGWGLIRRYHFDHVDGVNRAYQAIRRLPDGSVLIPGPGTPTAYYLNRLGAKQFTVIASGWGWPKTGLDRLVAGHLAEGRPVYVNLDPAGWGYSARKSGEWEQVQAMVRPYRKAVAFWPMVRLTRSPDTRRSAR